jgi:nucleotide-binding universal stress UspA family protein
MSRIPNGIPARVFRRILVPHDFSDHATRALEVAAGFAGPQSSITVLHAVAPVYASGGMPGADMSWTPPPEMIGDLREQLEQLVARVVGRTAAGRVHCRVVPADPLTAILAAARRADVIVMTTVGRTGLTHLLMGSVAEKVVRHATTPVLTLHPGAARRLAAAPRKRRRVSAR